MDYKQAAEALNGNQYGSEGNPELFAAMKDAGLIAIYGYSDDIAVINGFEHDEAYGKVLHFTPDGLLKNDCDDEDCPYFAKLRKLAATVNVDFDAPGFTIRITTDMPHASFVIKDDDDDYCQGIVFSLRNALARPV